MNAIEKIQNTLKGIELSELKVMAKMLQNNFEEGSCVVFSAVINELELRMPEKDFVSFCDNL
jgi:hypothetical protein